jgi:hypothetical protein
MLRLRSSSFFDLGLRGDDVDSPGVRGVRITGDDLDALETCCDGIESDTEEVDLGESIIESVDLGDAIEDEDLDSSLPFFATRFQTAITRSEAAHQSCSASSA